MLEKEKNNKSGCHGYCQKTKKHVVFKIDLPTDEQIITY
jgi:hypothetical protein